MASDVNISCADVFSISPPALQRLPQQLSTMAKHSLTIAPRKQLQKQGSPAPRIYLLQSGWLACSITLKSGSRQVTNLHLAGDIVGLPNLGRATAFDAIHAITEATLGIIEPSAIGGLFREEPRAAAELYLRGQVEHTNSMTQLAMMGRANALERMAGLIIQMVHRVGVPAAPQPIEVDVPLTQDDIADLIGLTNVHVNRVVRHLRESGIATWAYRRIVIYDLPALQRIADFVPEGGRDLSWLSGDVNSPTTK